MTYRGYRRVFAISHGVQDALTKWQPQLASRCKVIYNGVPAAFNEPRHKAAADPQVILSVGNLRTAKNYPLMLRAFAALARSDCEYWIAGDGPDKAALVALTRDLGISAQVRFLGHVTPLQQTLEQADVFLMASRWEGFGLAAVEAMNASLPLVISDIPGLRELNDHRRPCAITVDPASAASIAAGLRQLLDDPGQRRVLGQAAWARSARFSLQRMVDSYRDEYDALAHPQ